MIPPREVSGENRGEREVVLAVVGRPWGVKGQFLLDPMGTDPAALLGQGRLRLRRRDGRTEEHALRGSHVAGGRLVVHLQGCGTVEEAERWRGAEVVRREEEFAPAPDGSFYPHELVGLEVADAGGRALGHVAEVLETGGPELLVVRKGDRERLIPFAAAICRTVDKTAGRIVIDPPEGLLDLDQMR